MINSRQRLCFFATLLWLFAVGFKGGSCDGTLVLPHDNVTHDRGVTHDQVDDAAVGRDRGRGSPFDGKVANASDAGETIAVPAGDAGTDGAEQERQNDERPQGRNDDSGRSDGPTNLPKVTGTCPEFRAGDVTFSPKGVGQRRARIWIGPEAQAKDGPLIFYWQGTGMSPNNATWHVGRKAIDEVTSMGGMVVAPYPDPSLEFPWFLSNGRNVPDDFLLADEILACAIETVGIDIRRIHATGISAGGLMSAEMLIRRANYMASAAPQSGAIGAWTPKPVNAEPSNKTSAIVFHGGAGDRWPSGGLDYPQEAVKIADEIVGNGGFALLCNHNGGHRVPMDAIDAIWQFFKDHPWNTSPSPYAKGVPNSMPEYCRIHR